MMREESNEDNKLIYRTSLAIRDSPKVKDHNTNFHEELQSDSFTMLLPEKHFQLNSNEMLLQYTEGTLRNTNSSIKNKDLDHESFEKDLKKNKVNGNMQLPFDIQNAKKPMMRRSREFMNRNINYQSLCPIKRVPISLETLDFDYRPNHYVEVTCANRFSPNYSNIVDKNKICSEAGFSCMQLNRTIHLIRRNKSVANECWESEIRVVPSGCECMWPKHYYGDILAYHESQKRLTNELFPFLHVA